MYHDKQTAIIVEHDRQIHSQQAVHTLSFSHPDFETILIDDLKQIINNADSSTSHTLRYHSQMQIDQHTSNEVDQTEHQENVNEYTYRLRHVLSSISQEVILSHLTYYREVIDLQEDDNLLSSQRKILYTFHLTTNLRLLDHIWAVNIHGYNISIAKAHYKSSQLDYRKQHVAGF